MESKQIANTIWQQMRAIDMNLVMCMGVTKPTVIENGLQFTVNGLSFKGLVKITLNGADLYDIKLVKPVRKQNQKAKELGVKMFDTTFEVKEEINDVYFDMLMPILEDRVENRNVKVG